VRRRRPGHGNGDRTPVAPSPTAPRVSPTALKGGGSTATEEPGGGLVPTNTVRDPSALILLAFEPPYLPALGGRAGTFPPFGSASGGTAARCARWLFPHSAPPLGERRHPGSPLAALRGDWMALTSRASAHILWWFTTSTLECFYEEDLSTKSSASQASARLQESDANPSRA